MAIPDPHAPPHVDGRGMPRWVKVFCFVALVVLLVIIILTDIGPGRSPRPATPAGERAPATGSG